MRDWKLPWDGGCRCGATRVRVTMAPLLTMACHCKHCQRMTASAFSLSAAIPAGGLSVTRGTPVVAETGSAHLHHFCPRCMSWMFTRTVGMDGFVNLRATMLDDADWFAPFIETWTRERLPWATTPAAHSFPEFPAPEAYEGLSRDYAGRASG